MSKNHGQVAEVFRKRNQFGNWLERVGWKMEETVFELSKKMTPVVLNWSSGVILPFVGVGRMFLEKKYSIHEVSGREGVSHSLVIVPENAQVLAFCGEVIEILSFGTFLRIRLGEQERWMFLPIDLSQGYFLYGIPAFAVTLNGEIPHLVLGLAEVATYASEGYLESNVISCAYYCSSVLPTDEGVAILPLKVTIPIRRSLQTMAMWPENRIRELAISLHTMGGAILA